MPCHALADECNSVDFVVSFSTLLSLRRDHNQDQDQRQCGILIRLRTYALSRVRFSDVQVLADVAGKFIEPLLRTGFVQIPLHPRDSWMSRRKTRVIECLSSRSYSRRGLCCVGEETAVVCVGRDERCLPVSSEPDPASWGMFWARV